MFSLWLLSKKSWIQLFLHFTQCATLMLRVKKPSKETYSENKRIKNRQIYKYIMYNYRFLSFCSKTCSIKLPPVSQTSRASPCPLCNVVPYIYFCIVAFLSKLYVELCHNHRSNVSEERNSLDE